LSANTWTETPLRFVSTDWCDGPFGSGLASEHYRDSGARVVRLQNIRSGEFAGGDEAFIDEGYFITSLNRHAVAEGDVLVAGLGDDNNFVGRACVAPAGLGPTLVKADCFRFRLDRTKAEPRFIAYALTATAARAAGELSGGSTRQRINLSTMASRKVALPSLDTQVNISNFLDQQTARMDALIAAKLQLIERLAELRYSTVSWAVTGGLHERRGVAQTGNPFVPQLPTGWTLGGLTKYIGPVVDYRGKTPEKVPEGVLLVTARNIRDGQLDYDASSEYVRSEDYDEIMRRGRPALGDVLFTTEAPLGQVANVDREGIALAQRVVKFRGLHGVLDNYFLKYWLMGDAVQATLSTLATGSTAEGIKASKLGQIPLAVPPLTEQLEVVTFLDERRNSIDSASQHVHEHIERLREYRSSLISAAVTGQLNIGTYSRAAAVGVQEAGVSPVSAE
jgi:type I restriction enzyme, S subunit